MGRKDSFLDGFMKQASFALKLKKLKKPLMTGAALAGAGYGAGKLISATEDPEQARLRQLRKAKALPYQQGQS